MLIISAQKPLFKYKKHLVLHVSGFLTSLYPKLLDLWTDKYQMSLKSRRI